MRRRNQLLLIMLTFLAFPAVVSAASITYTIDNYPALQNGWTLSGTITTDGTIGELESKNLTAWMFTISMGSSSFTYSNKSEGATISRLGGLQATATALLLPMAAATGGVNEFNLGVSVVDASATITWIQQINLGGDDISRYQGYVQNQAPNAWNVNPNDTTGLGGKANWIIASVPEPSSFCLAGLGVVCGVLGARTRQRKARRESTHRP
jgi:hypothetical protein